MSHMKTANRHFGGILRILTAFAAVVFGVCPHVWATGFGLYEASAKSYAMGGAVIGHACDASANFHNPATLTDFTNAMVSVGFMTEHPRGRIKVNDGEYCHMDPGLFLLPSFQAAVPLGWDVVFGLGIMPEVGLGSAYDENWPLACNSKETTVTSFTVNPNLAWKVTDDWSIAGGFRFLYFDFEQYSSPWVQSRAIGQLNNRLKGDNNFRDWGWQVGTKYDLLDNLSLGIVYKSRTLVHVKGKTQTSVRSVGPYGKGVVGPLAESMDGPAETELLLPQSITAGINYRPLPRWEVAGMVSWTEWSTVDTLDFKLNRMRKDINLKWDDTWRFGLATGYEFVDDWTLIGSYVFETDCTGDQLSTMLPGSQRHLVSLGLDWRISDHWSCCLVYGIIFMDGLVSHAKGENDVVMNYEAHRALSHAAGFTLTYSF